jgi:formamidopyrimidine-DNA glycosylase
MMFPFQDPINGKKTEVTHLRMSGTLLHHARDYHQWRKQTHPRLTLQAALNELIYVGLGAIHHLRHSMGQEGEREQALLRSENQEFATKLLGDKDGVESPY